MDADWKDLCSRINHCEACKLGAEANNRVITDPVEYRGSRPLMVIGEAPGETEDLEGRPFVGRAGVLLRQEFQRIGLKKRHVYVTNCLHCRPPNNRDPFGSELRACKPFLIEKIDICRPKYLILVGKVASSHVLGIEPFPITRMAGKEYRADGLDLELPAFVILHPSYALRGNREEFAACMDKLADWLHEKGIIE